jgi:hypothetical protein
VWEDPVAHPNLREQDSPELTARSASRLDAVLGGPKLTYAEHLAGLHGTLSRASNDKAKEQSQINDTAHGENPYIGQQFSSSASVRQNSRPAKSQRGDSEQNYDTDTHRAYYTQGD